MKKKHTRWLTIGGLVLMVAGALDPLEGSVVIVAGTAMAAFAAWFNGRFRLPAVAFALTAIGVAALVGLSALGGVGGDSGRSIWLLLLCAPYPVGWVLGIVGAVRKLRQPAVA
jgi:hypothetical protein